MLNLKRITIQNFRSISEATVEIGNQGLVSILGNNLDDRLSPSNGSGKTTLLSAICWNLFGSTLNGKSGDDVLSWTAPKNCFVISEWEKDGVKATITRYRKHKDHANDILFEVSDNLADVVNNKNAQKKIEEYLGFDYDIFTTILTMGCTSKSFKPFLLMSDTEKKEFTDVLLNLQYIVKAKDLVEADYKVNSLLLTDNIQRINMASQVIDTLKSQIIDYQEKEEGLNKRKEKDSDTLKGLIESKTKDAQKLYAEVVEAKNVVDSFPVMEELDRSEIFKAKGRIETHDALTQSFIKDYNNIEKEIGILNYSLKNNKIDSSRLVNAEFSNKIKYYSEQVLNLNYDIKTKESLCPKTQPLPEMNTAERMMLTGYEKVLVEVEYEIRQNKNKMTLLRANIHKYSTTETGCVCLNCMQTISKEVLSEVIDKLNSEILELESKNNTLNENIYTYKGHIEELEKKVVDRCKREYAEKVIEAGLQIDKAKHEIADLNIKIEAETVLYDAWKVEEEARLLDHEALATEETLKEKEADKEKLLQTIAEMSTKKTDYIKALECLEQALEIQIKNREDAIAKLASLKQNYTIIKSNYTKLYDDIELNKKQLKVLREEINPYTELIQKNLLELNKKSDIMRKQQDDNKVLEQENEYLSFWITGFGNAGIKSYILDSVVGLLNNKANVCLQKLSNDLSIKFVTQDTLKDGQIRDKFTVIIKLNGEETEYIELSKGERARVSLAVNIALKSLAEYYHNIKINFDFYDEALDGLDYTGCEQVINYLKEQLKYYSSIFVVSHIDSLKLLFEKNITAVKQNKVTKYIVEE